jgi:hypothetical protein
MATNKTFNCDICPSRNIKDGITLVFEHDMSGNINATIRLQRAFKGLKDVDSVAKLIHICSNCQNIINNPVDIEKNRL